MKMNLGLGTTNKGGATADAHTGRNERTFFSDLLFQKKREKEETFSEQQFSG